MDPIDADVEGGAASVSVRVLGAMVAERNGAAVRLSSGVRQLLALLVAARSDGLTKEAIAREIWQDNIPVSWQSSIRNRVTEARRKCGSDAIVRIANRYRLSGKVEVDAWLLIDGCPSAALDHEFEFLDGMPFDGMQMSPRLDAFSDQVLSARSIRISERARVSAPLSSASLLRLRTFHQRHPLEAEATEQIVRALLVADEPLAAHQIIEGSRRVAKFQNVEPAWLEQVSSLAVVSTTKQAAAAAEPAVPETDTRADKRVALFEQAIRREQWTIAYDIAMEGMPSRMALGGEADRVALLLSLPSEKLGPKRALQLALTIAREVRLLDPEQARRSARSAQALATTPSERFMTEVVGAIVGEVTDERALFALPPALVDGGIAESDMALLQVVMANHLERADSAQGDAVSNRFLALVDRSDDPFRRWLGLVLEAALSFTAGDWEAAREKSAQAQGYGDLFSIGDADFALLCQRVNEMWVLDPASISSSGLAGNVESGKTPIGRAFAAAVDPAPGAVDAFISEFDINTRMIFCVPVLMLLSPAITDPELKRLVRERLQHRTGTSALFRAGHMHLGPVDRMCALLDPDPETRRSSHVRAIEVADRQQTRLWQVLCRLEMAADTGDRALATEAAALANTPALAGLVDRFGPTT